MHARVFIPELCTLKITKIIMMMKWILTSIPFYGHRIPTYIQVLY